jgi:nucleotide-binding universal stress UspA family protein
MYQSIVVAADGSTLSERAVASAGALAKALGAKLTMVTVTEQMPTFAAAEIGWSVPATVYDDIRRANSDRAKTILRAAQGISGIDADAVHIEEQVPYQGILDAAGRVEADLIVMGSHGHRGIERLILGSQAAKVLSLATIPVLIVKSAI